MASAVFSISYNFIPNGDMFGILDNISELVQKSITSSWHHRTYENVSLMEQQKKKKPEETGGAQDQHIPSKAKSTTGGPKVLNLKKRQNHPHVHLMW